MGWICKVGTPFGFGGKAREAKEKWYRCRPFLGNIICMTLRWWCGFGDFHKLNRKNVSSNITFLFIDNQHEG